MDLPDFLKGTTENKEKGNESIKKIEPKPEKKDNQPDKEGGKK